MSVLKKDAQMLIICLIRVTNQRKCDDISFISRAREACAEQNVSCMFCLVLFFWGWLVVNKKHCNWKEVEKKGKREERGLYGPRTRPVCTFCHSSKFPHLRAQVEINQRTGLCVNENQQPLCVCDSWRRSTHPFITRHIVSEKPSVISIPAPRGMLSIHIVPSSTSTTNLLSHNWWTVCTRRLSHQSSVHLALCFVPSNLGAFLFFFEHPS